LSASSFEGNYVLISLLAFTSAFSISSKSLMAAFSKSYLRAFDFKVVTGTMVDYLTSTTLFILESICSTGSAAGTSLVTFSHGKTATECGLSYS
jgi:hypothetical protein